MIPISDRRASPLEFRRRIVAFLGFSKDSRRTVSFLAFGWEYVCLGQYLAQLGRAIGNRGTSVRGFHRLRITLENVGPVVPLSTS